MLSSYNIFLVFHYNMCHFFRNILLLGRLRKPMSSHENNQGQDHYSTKKYKISHTFLAI